jgi:prepilin-type N-terminal cleavage/methylation domain-containing protein
MKKGFTLIELLIVVSIIGILAVALVPSLTNAPARARDATRKKILNDAVMAVESYYVDYGRYPEVNFCVGPDADDIAYPEDLTDKANLIAYFNGNILGSPEILGAFCTTGGKTYAGYVRVSGGYWVYIQAEKKGTHVWNKGASQFEENSSGIYFAIKR